MVKMGTVWDRTAEFLSDNIGALLPISLLAFFVPASIEGNFEAAMVGATPGLVITLYLVQLAFAILSVWGSLVITAMALDLASSETAGALAGRRLGPALLVWIVMLLVIMAMALPIPMVLAANGADAMAIARGEDMAISGPVATFVALYALLLLVLLFWLAARLIVATPVIVRENRMFGALRQSWRLTRGLALRIVGVLILYAIVSWVAQLAANTVFGSIFALVAGGGEGVTLAGVLTSIVVAAVQTAFMVIAAAFTAKLYLALTAQAGLRTATAVPVL
ncbi:glycerophosphoryl diester phosphodiesterase membrane domain-containing protein [Sphingomonas sp. M1-B02]|uniref:glycerophosphoryl diester phosphodiesterase membrane domain-containing protein n=1 Tax=Sphingomonas sp. M1-B02 TaxID=3114300 RepID=UPI00223F8961|nr:glycerophosphoryl diester phosphodiesterase membrane domain-containing protein [Sphingomonas sp. S6-11]UZK66030.1 glycerophosphoryl diester phosphodiesterase membrane domain-containing protein [Sphingomonas sp. S6-11]